MIYIIYYSILSLLSSINLRNTFFFYFITLTVLIGTRLEVGGDWFSYIAIYDEISHQGTLNTDISYYAINLISQKLGLGILGVNLICAALGTFPILFLFSKFPNKNLTVTIAFSYLFLVVGMGYTRQYVATGFLCLFLYQLMCGNIKKSILFLLIAASFHKTAIFFIIFLLKKEHFFKFLALSFVLFFIFHEKIISLVDLYLLSADEHELSSAGNLPRIILHAAAALIIIIFLKNKFPNVETHIVFKRYAYISFLFLIVSIFYPSFTLIDRLAVYFLPLQYITFSLFVFTSSQKIILPITNLICAIFFFIIMEIWLLFGSWSHAWMPYKTYLDFIL